MNLSQDILERDLDAFSDPATSSEVQKGSTSFRVEFTREGHKWVLEINRDTGKVRATREDDSPFFFPSLSSLLASASFADLGALRRVQKSLLNDFSTNSLIPPNGFLNASTPLTTDFQLGDISFPEPPDHHTDRRIQIILMDGPAGVGKTSLIRKLVAERARSVGTQKSRPLLLHVSSLGKRLVSLPDLLAYTLQTLRAKITYDQVPVLVRHDLLHIAIDGFDELANAEGYENAWMALRDFLDETMWGGPIILAGRDTFISQQTFHEKLKIFGSPIDLRYLRLTTTPPSQAKSWLMAQHGWQQEDLEKEIANSIFCEGSYALRPYFLSILAPEKGWQRFEQSDAVVRTFLIERFLEREAGKIGTKITLSPEEAVNRLTRLFEEVAMEMSSQEAETIDLGFLELAVQVAFEGVPDVEIFVNRIGSVALLEMSEDQKNHRRFPHTEILNHFLATAIMHHIAQEKFIPSALRRTPLGTDFLRIFQDHIATEEPANIQHFISDLEDLLKQERSFDRLQGNVAAILLATMAETLSKEPRHLKNVDVQNACFSGVAVPCIFQHVTLYRWDIRGADLSNVTFDQCLVHHLIVDQTTHFSQQPPRILQLEVHNMDGTSNPLHNVSEINVWVQQHQDPVELQNPYNLQNVNQEAMELLDRTCRRMRQHHYIKLHREDDEGRKLVNNSLWNRIRAILGDRIRSVGNLGGKGPPAESIHIVEAESLLAERYDPATIGKGGIWDQVANIS